MEHNNMKTLAILIIPFLLATVAFAQSGGEVRWVNAGQLHEWVSEQGVAVEAGRIDLCNQDLLWPSEYGRNMRNGESRSLVIGVKDYFDPEMEKTFTHKVIQAGPIYNAYQETEFFNNTLIQYGKFPTPLVYVNNVPNHYLEGFDPVDEVDEEMEPIRKVINEMDSQVGIHIKREVFGYSNPKIDDVVFHDYVFTNNGIVNKNGGTINVTLKDVYFTFIDRLAFAGEGNPGTDFESGFAHWESTWGNSNIFQYFNPTKPLDASHPDLRGYYCYYGPFSGSDLTADEQWGLPDHEPQQPDNMRYHRMAAGNYTARIVLHADTSPGNPTNDLGQPSLYPWFDSDFATMRDIGPYDANLMTAKYECISGVSERGHPGISHQDFMQQNGLSLPENVPGWVGGPVQAFSFGPYTLAPGEDVHIVMADVVNGLCREKNREVAFNWYQYYNGTGLNPDLYLPNGSKTSNHNDYKKAWVETCLDSVKKSFDATLEAFSDGAYDIPATPPPPDVFKVVSGGSKVALEWSMNAEDSPGFDGYIVFRSKNTIADEFTQYVKILDCSLADLELKTEVIDGNRVFYDIPDTNIANSDSSLTRGFDYLYYLRAKAVSGGETLYSGMFYDMCGTIEKAKLLRPPVEDNIDSIVVVPNPYVITNRGNQFGEESLYDQIAFYNLPPVCTIKVFTERGDLIWKKEHTNYSGDDYWDQVTSSNMTIVSGIYIILFEAPGGKSTYRKLIIIR